MQNTSNKKQKKGKTSKPRSKRPSEDNQRLQSKIIEHFIKTRNITKETFHLLLSSNGHTNDYTVSLGHAFDVVHGYSCRCSYGVEVNDLPSISLNDDVMKSSIANIMRKEGLPEIEIGILLTSVCRAIAALEHCSVSLPDRDSCMENWNIIFRNVGSEIMEWSEELLVEGQPNYFERLTTVTLHLFQMLEMSQLLFAGQQVYVEFVGNNPN